MDKVITDRHRDKRQSSKKGSSMRESEITGMDGTCTTTRRTGLSRTTSCTDLCFL
ncbi:hypothetical protein [Rickettsiales endosymbiont of Peranema trichophorum]|uniref:hypothetical protein n=1 Tax=Rickettsiales endosymbiont of Peranema trichophorum TaxID=2486577 RepID=UPI0013EEDA4D|nr:hypothetical protein [Rickettsiales endosymbiont of Peranema trichophorum]